MRKIKIMAIVFLSMAVLSGCSSNSDVIQVKDRQITTFKKKIRSLEAELSTMKARSSQMAEGGVALTKAKERIQELEKQLDKVTGQYTGAKKLADQLNERLEKALADFKEKEKILLARIDNISVVTVSNSVMFSSGSARLTKEAKTILDRIIKVVEEDPTREIRIEGHTDNKAIARRFRHRFRSNWELSLSRALSVLHFLRTTYKVKPSRLAAVGYGEFRPVAENSTPEGRAANRRVVISVGAKMP